MDSFFFGGLCFKYKVTLSIMVILAYVTIFISVSIKIPNYPSSKKNCRDKFWKRDMLFLYSGVYFPLYYWDFR